MDSRLKAVLLYVAGYIFLICAVCAGVAFTLFVMTAACLGEYFTAIKMAFKYGGLAVLLFWCGKKAITHTHTHTHI